MGSGRITPNSITVHWEEVACLDQNGEITGYIARAMSNGRAERTAKVGSGAREAMLSGLTPSTEYIVQVAAVKTVLVLDLTAISLCIKQKVATLL